MQNCLVITGASRGIGAATARVFLSKNWQVVNISRTSNTEAGVHNINADMTAPGWSEPVNQSLQELLPASSRICLVHNAAMLLKDSVKDIDAEAYRRVLELNMVAPVQLNRMVLPHMAEGSSIIYIVSTLGTKAVANSFSYVSSKHGQIGMMRATCQDLAGQGMHTAAICPGFTDTEMLNDHVGRDEEILQALRAGVTLGRLVEPEEIAETVAFCAAQPVINGAVLHANLGQIEH